MRTRYKIKTKYFISLSLVGVLIGVWIYLYITKTDRVCNQIDIVCKNFDMQIYNDSMLLNLLEQKESTKIKKKRVQNINLSAIKKTLLSLPWIKKVNLFFTMHQTLEIDIYYYTPVGKIYFTSIGKTAYLGSDSNWLPAVEHLILHVPIIISTTYQEMNFSREYRYHLVRLLALIRASGIWNQMFGFIEIGHKQNIIVHEKNKPTQLIIGTLDNLKNKIRKFEIFYRNLLQNTKKKFTIIDLRFKNQIITQ